MAVGFGLTDTSLVGVDDLLVALQGENQCDVYRDAFSNDFSNSR